MASTTTSSTEPTPEHWARLLRLDPTELDLSPARERALQRLTKPLALLILAIGYAVGALLTLVGLDVAGLTGTNTFGFFLLESAFNGTAVMVLSAPLWFFALTTPTAVAYRRRVVQWIITADVDEARRYLDVVEGGGGLIWRFAIHRDAETTPHIDGNVQASERFVVALRRWKTSELEAMLDASRNGNVDAIDLDLYRDAVAALQRHAEHHRADPYDADPYGANPYGADPNRGEETLWTRPDRPADADAF